MKYVKNKLRVSHYPQIPCQPFHVDVKDEEQALLIMDTLANQHLFLYENNFIPDYSNMITVTMWDEEDKEWYNYWNEEEGMEWEDFVEAMVIEIK